MTLSGTWCGGSEVRFMSAVESVANCLTKTALESFRCDGLFKSNIHNRVGRAVRAFEFGTMARCKIRLALCHNSAAEAASFYVRERADQAPSASGSLAGIWQIAG
jgi:hypothetical protein